MIRADKPTPLYVLDGPSMFPIITGLTRMMQYGGSVPPCLVIGIGYEDDEAAEKNFQRAYDLTPTKNGRLPNGRYGGAAEFRSFLNSEITPLIEKSFNIDPRQSTLIGHSLGGMFALQTAVVAPKSFANVLALSPSLWFDNDLVLNQIGHALATQAPLSRIVALAGDREQEISGAKFNMSRNVELLKQKAIAAKRESKVFATLLQDTTHHTIQGPGFAFGLRKLLDPTPPSLVAGCPQSALG
jgi:predicted alpha/beta superfamily hydrolase